MSLLVNKDNLKHICPHSSSLTNEPHTHFFNLLNKHTEETQPIHEQLSKRPKLKLSSTSKTHELQEQTLIPLSLKNESITTR